MVRNCIFRIKKILNIYFKEGDELYVWGTNFEKKNKSQINFEEMKIIADAGGATYSEQICKNCN